MIGFVGDVVDVVTDAAKVVADFLLKDFVALGLDILSATCHVLASVRDFIKITGGSPPLWLTALAAMIDTVSALVNGFRFALDLIEVFTSGPVEEIKELIVNQLKNVANAAKRAAIGFAMQKTSLGLGVPFNGLTAAMDWIDVQEAQIDNETPGDQIQWCAVHKASYC